MRAHTATLILLLTYALPACGPVRNYRRTGERDLNAAIEIERSIRSSNPSEIFETLREELGCAKTRNVHITATAECLGKDKLAVTVLSMVANTSPSQEFSIDVQTLDPTASRRTVEIARGRFGPPVGYTADGSPAWNVSSGVLLARDGLLRLERPESGDVHDLMETVAEPRLPSPDDALKRIHRTVDSKGGSHGARSTPAKLVALMGERMPLLAEGCVGDLLLEGREICFGRGMEAADSKALTQVHAFVTARRGYDLDVSEAAVLLGAIVGGKTRSILETQLARQQDDAFAIVRDGNFAIVSTRQQFADDPFAYHHLIVMRRVALTPNDEAAIRNVATTPPINADFDEDLVRDLMAEEAKRRQTSR